MEQWKQSLRGYLCLEMTLSLDQLQGDPAQLSSSFQRDQRFHYLAYGLGVSSSLELPELVSSEEEDDILIWVDTSKREPLQSVNVKTSSLITESEARFSWEHVGSVLIRGGKEIVVEPEPGVDEQILRLYILGPALAMLLHQRGFLILHASAVGVNGGAVAFAGWSGWGKSTMAGAMHHRGATIVADDFIAISLGTGTLPVVTPGFPRIKLWPDAAWALGCDPKTMPRLHPKLEKRDHSTRRGFNSTPLALERLYVLADGPTLGIQRLSPQEALVELIRHTYGVRLLQNARPPSHLQQYASVVNSIPVCRLTAPRNLALLPDLARLVEEDALRH